MASIHLQPMEVSIEQRVLYLHGALDVGKSRRGAIVETASGGDLRGATWVPKTIYAIGE